MLGFGKELTDYWQSFIRLIYPANCVLCRIPLRLEETYLCVTCTQKIEPLKAPTCVRCARPMAPFGRQRSTCNSCRSDRPYYDRGFALLSYQEPVSTLFHQIKFQNKVWLLRIFLDCIQRHPNSYEFKNYEMIIPVPLDSRRARERGFNQALIIAKMLKRTDKKNTPPIVPLLRKVKKTLPQSQLRREERLNNLAGAFTIRKQRGIRGKQILLVDDIFTTGSTINECTKVLKEAGADRVDFFTIARSHLS